MGMVFNSSFKSYTDDSACDFFNLSFRFSEKVTEGVVGIREHKHNQIDLWAMGEGRIKKKWEGWVLNNKLNK